MPVAATLRQSQIQEFYNLTLCQGSLFLGSSLQNLDRSVRYIILIYKLLCLQKQLVKRPNVFIGC